METYFEIIPTDIYNVVISKLYYDDYINVINTFDIDYKLVLRSRFSKLYNKIEKVKNTWLSIRILFMKLYMLI
jgi:hypothetical protein